MSRHRHVRNLRYDDYADDDDNYYDDYSEEETDVDAAQYMWRGTAQPVNAEESKTVELLAENINKSLSVHAQPESAKEAKTVELLAENPSNSLSLQDDAFATARADASRIQNDSLATSGLSSPHCLTDMARARKSSPQMLARHNPSAIGALLEDTVSTDSSVEFPAYATLHNGPSTDENGTLVCGGRVLLPKDGDVRHFNFEQPSPDDLVMAKRGRGRERVQGAKLRLPKPSQNRIPKHVQRREAAIAAEKSDALAPSDSSSTTVKPVSAEQSVALQPVKSTGRKVPKLRVPKKTQTRVLQNAQQQSETQRNDEQSRGSASIKKPIVQRLKKLDVGTVAETRSKDKISLSIVVAGHVDAGKSTLLGQLLSTVGGTASRYATGRKGKEKSTTKDLAWLTDEDALERSRGVTIDICTRLFQTERNGRTTDFAMVDAPGHRDFVPAMIMGAMQASAAVLVVDASRGEFEAGVSDEGQTREHALLLRAMGVTRIVVAVNKLDTIDYDKKRYDDVVNAMHPFLKTTGWRPRNDTTFVPVAGRTGVNVAVRASQSCPLSKWYKGPTFLQALEGLADFVEEASTKRIAEAPHKPTRLMVLDSFRSVSLGGVLAVSGRLLSGSVAPRDSLVVGPWGEMATVKSVEVRGERVKVAIAGVDNTSVSLGLQDIPDTLVIAPGNVLSDPGAPVPIVTKLLAQIVVIASPTPILPGTPVEIHVGGGCEAATLCKLVRSCGKNAGKQARPRRLIKNDSAVVEIKVQRAVCLERAVDIKTLGRFTLRSQGRTVAAGIVLEILKARNMEKGV